MNRKKTLNSILVIMALLNITAPATGQAVSVSDEPASLTEAIGGGKVDINLRLRFEFVDQTGLKDAAALTERIRIGYGTLPYNGFSFYIDFEDIRAADDDSYNAAGLNNRASHAVIADPEDSELNQLYVNYTSEKFPFKARLGRQRLKLDDDRFVGNVGWRQNEQTFDAATVWLTPGDNFTLLYSYVWDVNRIFGPGAGRDFDSESHLINLSYDGLDCGKITVFAYLLDFENMNVTPTGPASSSDTHGIRFEGSQELSEEFSLAYTLSYANQSDAGDNATDYDADYYFGQLSLTKKGIGTIGVGYEVLGSDNSIAAFQTPLATGHKFNGWADVFLTTPATGLEDLYFYAAALLPCDIKGRIVYHIFEADQGGADYGKEIDLVLSRKINENWSITGKFSDFDGDPGFADRTKFWFQTTFSF